MKLRDLAGLFTFICSTCGRRSSQGTADLDGPAFKAYHCPTCSANLRARENAQDRHTALTLTEREKV